MKMLRMNTIIVDRTDYYGIFVTVQTGLSICC